MSFERFRHSSKNKAKEEGLKNGGKLKQWIQRGKNKRKSSGKVKEWFDDRKGVREKRRAKVRDFFGLPKAKKKNADKPEKYISGKPKTPEIDPDTSAILYQHNKALERMRLEVPDLNIVDKCFEALEASDIGADYKALMKNWILHHSKNEATKKRYIDRWEKDEMTIAELFKIIGNMYVDQDPPALKNVRNEGVYLGLIMRQPFEYAMEAEGPFEYKIERSPIDVNRELVKIMLSVDV